jgi:biopolymer transport protein ExbD
MKLIMPKDDKNIKDKTEIKESDALTILMGKGNQIYYYMGQIKPDGSNFTSSNLTDIRKVISDKKKEVMIQGKSLGYPADTLDKDFVVVIKPNKEASYKSVVDILDEMTINGVHRFALVDITDDENKLVKATESRNGIK